MKFVQKKTDRENIEKFFLEKVSRYSHIPVDVLKSHLNEELFLTQCAGFDSLDMLELLTELESKYDIKFSVEIEARMKTWSGQKILDELFMITNKKEPDNNGIKNIAGMYTYKNEVPYCKLTEQPCNKIVKAGVTSEKNACEIVKCVLFKNHMKYR